MSLQHMSPFIRPGTGHPTAESLRTAAALGDALVFLCPRRSKTFKIAYETLETCLKAADAAAYMLVDGSARDGLLAALSGDGHDITLLFPENTDQELLDLAPGLVKCCDDQTILRNFPEFWGRGIASVLLSFAAPDKLARHLRQNLFIEDPDGELCILRFHDPRVLARLSETLFDDQADQFFGDVIDAFVFEDAAGDVQQWHRPQEEQA